MGNVRVIDVHQSVYAVNDEIAAKTRARLKEEKHLWLILCQVREQVRLRL